MWKLSRLSGSLQEMSFWRGGLCILLQEDSSLPTLGLAGNKLVD